jgi:NAD-dependent deacetylase
MKHIESLTSVVKLADAIKKAKKIAVMTGAGISTDSGIPDFRSTEGSLWLKNASRVHIMSESHLKSKPKEFWPAYKDIFSTKIANNFEPNYGHIFLKELEDMGKEVKIFTQNVDGLHSAAGSSEVYEMHGTIKTAHCPKCGKKFDMSYINDKTIPRCDKLKNAMDKCNFILHPDVVLFGGMIHHYKEAEKYAKTCDLMLVLGSSLQVSPVNLIPLIAADDYYPAQVAIVNRDATDFDNMFNIVIHESISDTLKSVRDLLN